MIESMNEEDALFVCLLVCLLVFVDRKGMMKWD